MIVDESSYRAAKRYAERVGDGDTFRRSVNAYASRLVATREMVPVKDGKGRIVAWAAGLDEAWYAVDADAAEIVAGPSRAKADVLHEVGAAGSSKLATGVYEAQGLLVGRRRDLRPLCPEVDW